ncbi:MAG: DNA gyrase inhibitor YacG [Alphaproteobacteria bacterium]|nr:DNA gyrase inhibitor YacG [Alphaproteobacteria bacterium]
MARGSTASQITRLRSAILNSPSNDDGGSQRAAACPQCKSPVVEKYAPFCSKRCADVDLHRWLSGSYAIPAAEEDDSDGRPSGESEQ